MSEVFLTSDEKRCLQLWFRQAIAVVEQEEATTRLLRRDRESAQAVPGHRLPPSKRPLRRSKESTHTKEMVV